MCAENSEQTTKTENCQCPPLNDSKRQFWTEFVYSGDHAVADRFQVRNIPRILGWRTSSQNTLNRLKRSEKNVSARKNATRAKVVLFFEI